MAIAFVSASSTSPSLGGASNTWTGLTLAVGQRCLLVINKSNTETISSVVDNGGNAWTQLGTDLVDAGAGERWSTWEGVITTAATSITTTYSAASTTLSPRFFMKQHTGVNQSIAGQMVQQRQAAPTTATDAMTSGTLTPAAQPGLLSGFGVVSFNAGCTVSAGFADRGENAVGNKEHFEDKAITSTAAVAATFTALSNFASTTIAVYWQEAAAVVQNNSVMYIG